MHDAEPFSLLDACDSARFDRRVVTIEAGVERPFDEAEWRDTLVVVEEGELEIECRSGTRVRFARGDVLHLAGLGIRLLRGGGSEPVVLSAVSRRDPDELRPRRRSKPSTNEEG
jgi:hypothetical protein